MSLQPTPRFRTDADRQWLLSVAFLLLTLTASLVYATTAQEPAENQVAVAYQLRFSAPQTQRLTVVMTLPLAGLLAEQDSVQLHMPAWRPGRYVILDPAGGVVSLSARDQNGHQRAVHKTDKATWSIESHDAVELVVEYELYANSLGLRTRHVDDSHAFLSGSAVFLYAAELRDQPVEVHFRAPDEWQVASGLDPLPSNQERPAALWAPSFDVLIDSPIEIGLHDRIDFEVEGVPHEIIIWPAGRHFDRQRLITDFTKIVENQHALFGSFPYRRYVFMVHAGAGAGGGTEHLNSTIMQVPLNRLEGSLSNNDDYRRFLGLVAHEFFHTWNVKQLRPSSMVPYDLQHENYSTLFWLAEGTTSYFSDLTLVRTELIDTDKYLENVGKLIDGSRLRPGTAVQSLSSSSYDAWVKFNRSNPDTANTTVSFYSQGELASLALDLMIREESGNRHSLQEVLRYLYQRFPLAAGGYDRDDLENSLREVTGRDWTDFFARYIDGVEPLPFERVFDTVGLELYLKADKPRHGAKPPGSKDSDAGESESNQDDSPKPPRSIADTGALLRKVDGRAEIRSLRAGSAFYLAGLNTGDELIALDGQRIDVDHWRDLIEGLEPGKRVTVHFVRHGTLRKMAIDLGERPAASWRLQPIKQPTELQKVSYQQWIGHPWTEKDSAKDKDKEENDNE